MNLVKYSNKIINKYIYEKLVDDDTREQYKPVNIMTESLHSYIIKGLLGCGKETDMLFDELCIKQMKNIFVDLDQKYMQANIDIFKENFCYKHFILIKNK